MPHQVVLKSIDRSLCTIANLKFGKNVRHVRLDRLERDKKFVCDALIFIALGDELKHISLTRSQLLMKLHMIAVIFDLLADLLLNGQLASSYLTDGMKSVSYTHLTLPTNREV